VNLSRAKALHMLGRPEWGGSIETAIEVLEGCGVIGAPAQHVHLKCATAFMRRALELRFDRDEVSRRLAQFVKDFESHFSKQGIPVKRKASQKPKPRQRKGTRA